MNPQELMSMLSLQVNSHVLQADVPNLLAQGELLALLVVLLQIPSSILATHAHVLENQITGYWLQVCLGPIFYGEIY